MCKFKDCKTRPIYNINKTNKTIEVIQLFYDS